MSARLTLALGFLGAFQHWRGGSWNDAVGRHTRQVFPARAQRRALCTLRDAVRAASAFDVLELRIVGYSWGAWTALDMAGRVLAQPSRLAPVLGDRRIDVRLGLLDPVRFLRRPVHMPTAARIWNVYQRNGCYRGCPGRSAWYRGQPVPGAIWNHDVTLEGRERPMRVGIPPSASPDHIQMGYLGWGGYDEAMAAVLTDGEPRLTPPRV